MGRVEDNQRERERQGQMSKGGSELSYLHLIAVKKVVNFASSLLIAVMNKFLRVALHAVWDFDNVDGW